MECPLINQSYVECACVLNVTNLANAFELCNNQYQRCPFYQKAQKAKSLKITQENISATSMNPIPYFTLRK